MGIDRPISQPKTMGANWDLAMLLGAPAASYLGFRTVDKFTQARKVN